MSERRAYPNIGAEESADGGAPSRAREKLGALFVDIVKDPPWPWLERARGLVPWLVTDHATRRHADVWGPRADVVARVHDKAFALRIARARRIDAEIVDLAVILEPEELRTRHVEAIVSQWPSWASRNFTVKPRWGTSGRGRVAGKDGVAIIGNRAGSFTRGAIVEPWLDRVDDLSSLWFVDEHTEPHLLGTTKQIVRRAGVYLGCEVVITDVGAMAGTAYDEAAIERARVIVEAAAREGYRGPCGVDAFTWKDEAANVHLRGVVELNARFTAGHVALGLVARRAPAIGTRFRFTLDTDDVLTVVS